MKTARHSLSLIAILFLVFPAKAAQMAEVIVDEAKVYDQPRFEASELGTVKRDQKIPVSNVPTNGFYKTKISGGILGWISGNDIKTENPSDAPVTTEEKRVTRQKKTEKSFFDHSRIILSGGIQSLNFGGFPQGFATDFSKLSYGGTFEMQFNLVDSLYWGGRVDYLTGSQSGSLSGVSQSRSFSTIPLMLGLMFSPTDSRKFRFGVGIYGGVAILTKMKLERTSQTPLLYESSDLCGYGNLQFSYALSTGVSIQLEGGYRIHSVSYPEPSPAQAGFTAFKADYGGLVSRLGLEFRL